VIGHTSWVSITHIGLSARRQCDTKTCYVTSQVVYIHYLYWRYIYTLRVLEVYIYTTCIGGVYAFYTTTGTFEVSCDHGIYVIVVSCTQVICLICTPKPEGEGVHIRKITRASDTTDMCHVG